jgi:hypothetical protein
LWPSSPPASSGRERGKGTQRETESHRVFIH